MILIHFFGFYSLVKKNLSYFFGGSFRASRASLSVGNAVDDFGVTTTFWEAFCLVPVLRFGISVVNF